MSHDNKQPLNITINSSDYTNEDYKKNNNISSKNSNDTEQYIIFTNKKLLEENLKLQLKLKEKEEFIKLAELKFEKEKEILKIKFENKNENLEDIVDNEEKRRLCLKGWLHNLNDMYKKLKVCNDKYKKMNDELLEYNKKLHRNIQEIKNNLLYLLVFIFIIPIILYLFNIIGFINLLNILFLESLYLGFICYILKIIVNRDNFLNELLNNFTSMQKYDNINNEINIILKKVKKIQETCTEIDDIIDDI